MKRNLLMRLSKILRIRKVVKVHYETTYKDIIFKNLDPSKDQTIYFEVIQPKSLTTTFSFDIGDTTYHKERIEKRCKFTIPKGVNEISVILYGIGECDILYEPSKLEIDHISRTPVILSIDLAGFDTSKVTDMTDMFKFDYIS